MTTFFRSKAFRWSGLSLVLLAIGGGLYIEASKPTLEARFKVHALTEGKLTQTVAANGTLNPVVLVSVGTQVSGTVRKLYVDFNDKVQQGQPLLEIDSALLRAQIKQSEANLAQAKATLELAEHKAARIAQLFTREYVSRQESDESIQALKAARAQFALAQAQLEKDGVNLGNTVIRSPVAGVVVDRVVDLGQTVAASFQTPTLIKIAQDLSEMRIDTSFAEADIGAIRPGQKVFFTVDAFPERQFEGRVQQIRLNPTNQQNVVTYNVRVNVDNPDELLLPGMTAYVRIAVAERSGVLLVPNEALRFKPAEAEPLLLTPPPAGEGGGAKKGRKGESQKATVYRVVRHEGQARMEPVAIALGISDNRQTEVLPGPLQAGDQLVLGPKQAGQKPASVGMRLF